MKAKKAGPKAVLENACTELITPVRVMKVPKREREYVRMIRIIFHRFSMPRFSVIITECRNAVPVSQGISIAFSTGSQPQKPPQPRTSYAQRPPRTRPMERKIQAKSVQRRVVIIHSSFLDWPVISAAIANANGMTKPVKPKYVVGGCPIMPK